MRKVIMGLALITALASCSKSADHMDECRTVTLRIYNTFSGEVTEPIKDQRYCNQDLENLRQDCKAKSRSFVMYGATFYITYSLIEKE